jgi:pyruvate,water dikinase
LAALAQASLPVPPGFIVTRPVYQAFHRTGLSGQVGDEILAAFDDMRLTCVAVRSSALVEDSEEASWAGQFESYLGVDRDHLLGAIWLCWKSADSALVHAYARDHSGTSEEIALAVVVQEMVGCDIAGVVFTKNPVTNDETELMIEACYGLGEMLVQGLLTPDNYIVQKEPLRVKSTAVSEQNRQMRLVHSRVEEVDVDSRSKNSPKLTEDDILSLARLALRIEALYGVPQDIEWGLHHGTFCILQARPITT